MNIEYGKPFSERLGKLSVTDKIYIKRLFLLFGIGALSFLCFFISDYLGDCQTEDARLKVLTHFCSFWQDGCANGLRSAVLYCLGDMLIIIFIAFMGYTMLSTPFCRLTIILYCGALGYGSAILASLLIKEPVITCGLGAFLLFSVSKLAVFCTVLRSALLCEDFSYSFSQKFRTLRHPFLSKDSFNYLKEMASLCGCSIIINVTYLIIESLQNFTAL